MRFKKRDILGIDQNKERIETLTKCNVSTINNLATMLVTAPKEARLKEKLEHY